jgi:5-methyltetrahydrofolate corrinoid/iron sulfur protein methyltransferase
VLTVSGCQQYVPECIETVRILKVDGDPRGVQVGLSNVSNAVPNEMRPLINRVYCVMLMGAGLDTMIADPLDRTKQNEFIRIVKERDDSTAIGRLLLNLHDAVASSDELQAEQVDFSDSEQVAVWKTVQILLNKVIYADSYLRV